MIKLDTCIPFMVSEQVVDYDFDARTVDTGREKEEEVTTEKIDLPAFSRLLLFVAFLCFVMLVRFGWLWNVCIHV